MHTIQVVLDESLLKAADRHARRSKVNRSLLMRTALREYLERQQLLERERRDAAGYLAQTDLDPELEGWQKVAAWPED